MPKQAKSKSRFGQHWEIKLFFLKQIVVEAAGVEPASETTQQEESTCVSSSSGFRGAASRTGKSAEPLARSV